MTEPGDTPNRFAVLPSVDAMLRSAALVEEIEALGRQPVAECLRAVIADLRTRPDDLPESSEAAMAMLARLAKARLGAGGRSPVRSVFNLTGTILHTNLGRAILPDSAIAAVTVAAGSPSSLEFDLETGRRGDRERGLVERLIRLTGAEAATVVNNNAAAVVLALDTLARRREVPISRGELVEIGGAFRMPDIMTRAGCKMREVGTTNRTHLRDYEAVIGPRTAMLLKVHTSNYVVEGFTASVDEATLARLAHGHDLPLVVDLGSGALVDLARHGVPHEPTPMEMLKAGADLVTFSGDKLLGGPQAGLIVGRKDLIDKLKRNPLKRALRLDKMTLAALDAVLRLYEDPDRLAERLPTLRHLDRRPGAIAKQAERLSPRLGEILGSGWMVAVEPCQSEIGSGSLPGAELPSVALVARPSAKRGAGAALERLSARFRGLPKPVIGRVRDNGYWLDLRCLEDEEGFLEQLDGLADKGGVMD
jgi:L-seryl-tRNA(Ser) seleniumtransferase